jgi:cobalt-zinc-cadmium resistance protein CzcA
MLRDGVAIDEASIKGACLRLRPVLMTAVTTALGLIPLLFSSGTGSEVQRPLATVVVGGLVTSTILTLLVIPALYKWFAVKVEKEV